MRIAVDARELESRPTGVGRVVQGLLRAWPGDQDVIHLLARRPPCLHDRFPTTLEPGPARLPGFLWEQLILPRLLRRLRADVLLAPAYGMPLLARCPTAVGMHDCAFAAVPETFRPRERWRRRAAARIAARHAALLFTGSRFGAGEIHRHLGVEEERILELPYGVDDRFRPASAGAVAAVRRHYDIDGPLVLFVGSPLGRRDLSGLDAVVADLAAGRPGLELGIVGTAPERPTPLRAGRWLGYVPDADLPALYSAATALAYPSRYEGFGLPVLEALACDTPVVASRSTSLEELFRDRAVLVSGEDTRAWRQALAVLLDDEDERRRRVATAGPWARSRDWGGAARLLRRRLADAAETGS